MEALPGTDAGGVLLGVWTVLVAACLALLVTVARWRREARQQRAAAAEGQARSQTELAAMGRELDELRHDLADTRRAAELARRQPEYVITSLAGADDVGPPPPTSTPGVATWGRVVEDRVVDVLSRDEDASRRRVAAVVVRAVAVAHGVRHALSPDVLDRARAEAHVARRRSRRDRRRELREARRLVRAVRRDAAA